VSLKDRLIRQIAADGPMPLSSFMQLALHDPVEGYYATRPGLGEDFTTAPETSQIFGELIGLWLVHEWRALGAPPEFILAEIGPGRGTLMADALRIAGVAGGEAFLSAHRLWLVEASPALMAVQSERLGAFGPHFAAELTGLPDGPMLLVGNEYLDCLPARQFRQTGAGWRECVAGLNEDGQLALGLAADPPRLPAEAALTGAVVEVQPGLDLVIAALAGRRAPFRALFIDYGPSDSAPGDTLRAYSKGKQVDPLHSPGACDLTVDVDFGRLARLGRAAGLDVAGPEPQGLFLLGLGAQARLRQLIAAHPDQAEALYAQAQRLIDPADMGERFKAISLSSPGLPAPAGFSPAA
jgi:NADH dehydrogenase [ubiquinone] 1 alpha subcomplex assembly factor 7